MNEQELQQTQQEIEELEREAADMLTSEEMRYMPQLKAHLLRNGYRLIPLPTDQRIIQVMHVISGQWVMNTTANELQYAHMGKRGWVDILDSQHRENMARRSPVIPPTMIGEVNGI